MNPTHNLKKTAGTHMQTVNVEMPEKTITIPELADALTSAGSPVNSDELHEILLTDGYLEKTASGQYVPSKKSLDEGLMRIEDEPCICDDCLEVLETEDDGFFKELESSGITLKVSTNHDLLPCPLCGSSAILFTCRTPPSNSHLGEYASWVACSNDKQGVNLIADIQSRHPKLKIVNQAATASHVS